MRFSSGGSRIDSGSDGVTPSEQIRLVPPSSTKADDCAVAANATPEQPSFLQQFHAGREAAALDTLFSLFDQPTRRNSPPTHPANNAPNPQALAGGGAGIGGVSTPNAGGGGSSGGGGGAGPGVTNANQWLSFYANLIGSALTPSAMSSINQPAAHGPIEAVHTLSSLAGTTATPHVAATAARAETASASHTHPSPPTPPHKQPQGADPLFVLDMNTGETVPTNVALNSFSTWSEDLLAQVSGASVLSYTWDTSNAPDFTITSGQGTGELKGTWNSFTGTPRTETITVTENAQGGGQLSQTMTYLVAGTDSPAFASRPLTAGNFLTAGVVTPDQVATDQVSVAAGLYGSVGMMDGSAQTAFAMPGYNPNADPVGLVYNSAAAKPQPVFLVQYHLTSQPQPGDTLAAQLTLDNGTPGPILYYGLTNLNAGDWIQLALQGNASGLSSGRYPWTVGLAYDYSPPQTTGGYDPPLPTAFSGNVDIVNEGNSPYGAGWQVAGVEQIVPLSGGGAMLIEPDGTSLLFAGSGFTAPPGDFSTLTGGSGGYVRTLPDGTKINFDGSGRQTSVVDTDGNTTTYLYSGSQLVGIQDMNGQTTTLSYTGGLLSSIADPSGRTATVAHSGTQLTSFTDPGSNLWQYSYLNGQLFSITDPNNNITDFGYNPVGAVNSVTRADGTAVAMSVGQMNGMVIGDTGTQLNPMPAPLLATADQVKYTDANNQTWLTNLDWAGHGWDVQDSDPLGDTSLTYRDVNGLPWLSADPLARRTVSTFDQLGNATKVVAPDDSFWQYSYNGFSEVTQSTDPMGYITAYGYNAKGDLTSVTDALNETTTYAYNAAGLVTSETDPLNHATTYGYDSLNRLTSLTNALNQATTYAYDTASNLTATTDPLSYQTTYAYNTMGWMTGQTLPNSTTTYAVYSYSYDGVGNQTSETGPLGDTVTSGYDKMNRLLRSNDSIQGVTTYTYDNEGRETGMTNPIDASISYTYDNAGRQTGTRDLLGETTSITLDADGEQTKVTDPLNHTTTYTYTRLGQVSSVTDPLGIVTSYAYNAAGDQTGMSVGTLTWQSGYDKLHRLTSSTDPLNETTTYGFDAAGNATSVTDALGHATTTGYDALNRVSSVTDALTNATTYGYDAGGNQTSVTDPLGRLTTTTYDAQGRPLTVTDPRGGITSYTYDSLGDQTSLTDSVGNTTSFGYDTSGRLVSETNPLGFSTTYSYFSGTQMTSMTDADGRTTTFGYDVMGRPTSETWMSSGLGIYTATYSYNAASELTGASDPDSSYSYTYDADGRLTSVDNAGTPGVPTVTLDYGYDAYGDKTSLSDSLGGSITYGYDSALRLTSLNFSGSGGSALITMGYDAASRLTGLTRTAGSGSDTITSSYSYDSADRLTNITHVDTTKALTLANYTYGYDKASQLTNYQDTNSALTYGYDSDGELTSALGTLNGSSLNLTYSYDFNGNRNMTGYTTGKGNELTSDGTYSYTYDNAGNTLTQTNIATGSVTYYSWDYHNQLTEVQVKDKNGTLLNDEKFTYDVFGNRIDVSLNGVQQLYTVYDGSNPYIDFNGSGTLTERYLTNPNALSQYYGEMNGSGAVDWFLTDNINSIRQVVSASGTSLDAITYDPYGNIVSQTNAGNAPRFGYAGGEHDALTGEDRFGKRVDKPADGGWLSADPIRQGTNWYAYAGNDPTNATDPTGLYLVVKKSQMDGIDNYFDGKASFVMQRDRQSVRVILDAAAYEALDYYPGSEAFKATLKKYAQDESTAYTYEDVVQAYRASLKVARSRAAGSSSIYAPGPVVGTSSNGNKVVKIPNRSGLREVGPNNQLIVRDLELETGVCMAMSFFAYYMFVAGPTAASVVVPEMFAADAVIAGSATARGLPWTSWQNATRVTVGGREYAQIGGRLYTQHAIERMMPSGLSGYGRSVAPAYVEEAVRTGTTTTQVVNGATRTIYSSGSLRVVTEDGGRIIVTVENIH